MKDEAKKLVQALIDSGEIEFHETYTLTRDGKNTGNYVFVLVVKTDAEGNTRLKEVTEFSVHKAVAGPKGVPCPLCGGSGKV